MTFETRVNSIRRRFSGAAAQPPKERFAVQITLTGTQPGTLYIANMDRGLEIAPYDYHDHTAALTISAQDLQRFLSGTLRLERALERGLARAEGDLGHIQLLHSYADPPVRRNTKPRSA